MRTQKRMCGITKTRIGEICKETNRGHYTNIRVVIHGCRYWKDFVLSPSCDGFVAARCQQEIARVLSSPGAQRSRDEW